MTVREVKFCDTFVLRPTTFANTNNSVYCYQTLYPQCLQAYTGTAAHTTKDCQAFLMLKLTTLNQARREGGVQGGQLPRAPRRLGAPPSVRNIKYARMYHFEKKFKKNFPRGAPYKCLGAPRECFPGPCCGSRRACTKYSSLHSRRTELTAFLSNRAYSSCRNINFQFEPTANKILHTFTVTNFSSISKKNLVTKNKTNPVIYASVTHSKYQQFSSVMVRKHILQKFTRQHGHSKHRYKSNCGTAVETMV